MFNPNKVGGPGPLRFFFLILFSLQAAAGHELWENLPATLPIDILEKDFVEYREFPAEIMAPLAGKMFIDGKKITGKKRHPLQKKIFREKSLVYLPDNKPIVIDKVNSGKEVWTYPESTRLVHYISLKTNPEQAFELRLLEKEKDETWSMGLYHLEDQKWVLQRYTGFKPRSPFKVQGHTVKMTHIRLRTCKACHAATSTAAYQYNQDAWPKFMGPCGFVPGHNSLDKSWEEKFQQKRNFYPFKRD